MGRKRTRKVARHQAHMALTYERSLDLEVRAKQAGSLQMVIGEFVAGLLVHGEPLTIAVSARRGFNPDPDKETMAVSIYWYKASPMSDLELHTDVAFMRRCLTCGEYLRGEHVCPTLDPHPSQKSGEGDDQLDEIKT